MSTEQTLRAIFTKVRKNGYKFRPRSFKKFISDPKEYFHVIFNQAFCIALWGSKPACNCAIYPDARCEFWDYEAWEYHLTRMVLEDPAYIYLLERWNKKPITPHMREQQSDRR